MTAAFLRTRPWLTGALALAWIVGQGCTHSAQEKGGKFLATGIEQLQKHDYARAILAFRNAAQAMPKEAEPQYQLGMAYLASGDPAAAVASFRRALARNPKHAGAQLKLAQLMAMTSDPKLWSEARDRLRELTGESSLKGGDTVYSLAFTELKLGNIQEATSNLEQMLARSPGELNASILLALARLSANDAAGAEEALKKAVAEAPTSASAQRILGRFYMDRNRPAEAEKELRRALELDPRYAPALLDLASLQLTQNRSAEGEATLRRLAALRDAGYTPVYGLFLFQQGRRDEAVAEFERVARENPEDRGTRTRLVAAYNATGRQRQAEALLAEALKRNHKDVDALLQRGEIYIAARRYAEAEADLNQILKLNPNSPEVHYALGKLNQARGEKLTYRAQLTEALRLNPLLLPIRIELAGELRNSNDPKGALAVLDATPEAQKGLTAVLVQRNWALWSAGDLAAMRAGIDQGLARERSVDLLIQNGLWKGRTNDPAGARAAAEEALRIDPANVQALELLNRSYVAQKMAAAGAQKVKEYAARQPKSAATQGYLGQLLLGNGDRAGARAALLAAKAADPNFVAADKGLVQLDVLEGKYQDAAKRLETLSKADRDATVQLWLGDVALLNKNPAAAITYFRSAVSASPSDADAANNLAFLLAEHTTELDEALKHAQKAVELAPEDPAFSDTLGWVLYRKGLYAPAVQHLERATAKGGNVVWTYHLAMAYAKAGNVERGRATLNNALKTNPNVPEAALAREVLGNTR